MASKYYVSVRPQTNALHAVHKEGCPFLPDDGKRILLGEFNSGGDALRVSTRHFTNTGDCLFCCREKHDENITAMATQKPGNNITYENLKGQRTGLEGLTCCVN